MFVVKLHSTFVEFDGIKGKAGKAVCGVELLVPGKEGREGKRR